MYSLKQGNRANADEDDHALTAEKKLLDWSYHVPPISSPSELSSYNRQQHTVDRRQT